ncbi:MAG: leucyl aminopeptidase family protein [Rickettsiales bacterium]
MPYFSPERASATPIHPVTASGLKPWLAKQPVTLRNWVSAQNFVARPDTALVVPGKNGHVACVLAGVEGPGLWALAHLPAVIPAGDYRVVSDWSDDGLRKAAVGFALAQYQYTRYRAQERKNIHLCLPKSIDRAGLVRRVEAHALVRDLINTPPNDMGPVALAEAAKQVAERIGAKYRVIVGEALLKQNYPAIHAVGRAAEEAPRLIELTHGKKTDPLVVLVGKGVTFDTGGLDLKPYASMKLMKKDMGGAALMLGLAQWIVEEKLPIRLRVLIPAVENSVSGNAFRPQDILQSRKGLTIEIGSTDAEGRLILADALADGDEDKPDLMIDAATLTGAARTALGTELPAMFCNRDDVAHDLLAAAERAQDPLWRLPLWKGYAKYVNSPIADVTNSPNYGFAGSITAALFLERFVSPTTPWIHLDTYAWNGESLPGRPAGGEALGLRALFSFLHARYAVA